MHHTSMIAQEAGMFGDPQHIHQWAARDSKCAAHGCLLTVLWGSLYMAQERYIVKTRGQRRRISKRVISRSRVLIPETLGMLWGQRGLSPEIEVFLM